MFRSHGRSVRQSPKASRVESPARGNPPDVTGTEIVLPTPLSLGALRDAAADCRACPLWEHATQTVFGAGSARAQLMLVGEQPGDQEDRAGEPFVGPAGKLLDRGLEDAGIDRSAAY